MMNESTQDTTNNVELCVRLQTEMMGEGRLALADELLAPDFVDHEAPSGSPQGPEGMKGTARWLHSALDNIRYEVHDVFGGGDRIALRCTMSGVHRGEFFGHPPTGRRFSARHIHIYRMVEGQVSEHWAVRDDLAMLSQLGITSSTESLGVLESTREYPANR